MLKVMTIIGTRPELIKMSRVIAEFDTYTNHILVHTGQNSDYELSQIFFDDMEIRKPDYFLKAVGETAAETIGLVINKADKVLREVKPDAVMLYGDTNSCLAVIAAKKLKIPVFHMEAGNRCFDHNVPEEINRKIVDHLSDINLTLTEHARRYLIQEGIQPERVIKTGSHMHEVLNFYMQKIEQSSILQKLNLTKQGYFLVSAHREENVDEQAILGNLLDSFNLLVGKYNLPIIVSTHPRTKTRLEQLARQNIDPKIIFMKPFAFTDYINLQMNALCILSDSGTITEESSLLNLPSITIRNTHERPEGMDAGILIMSGLHPARILEAVQIVIEQHKSSPSFRKPVNDYYEAGEVSKKILRIVQSYTDYINRVVWYKDKIGV